ncbi:MAG: type IV pilus modification protein PilV [Burkholderiaceae bacterium]
MKPFRKHCRLGRAATQKGSSLIEVVVAIMVLSVGMLAYVGLQAESLQFGKMAQFRTVATQLATDYIDRARGNSDEALRGTYDFAQAYAPLAGPLAIPACAIANNCTELEMAAQDIALWRNNARLALPGGSLFALSDALVGTTQPVDLWVIWQDPDAGDEAQVGGDCPDPLGVVPAGVRCMHFRFAL